MTDPTPGEGVYRAAAEAPAAPDEVMQAAAAAYHSQGRGANGAAWAAVTGWAMGYAAGYLAALRDVAGWITDDLADGVYDGTGNEAARSIAARLRDQTGGHSTSAPAGTPRPIGSDDRG